MGQVLDPESEARRRSYLKLMGLAPYYARKRLENAGPSPVFPFVEEPEKAVEIKTQVESRTSASLATAVKSESPPKPAEPVPNRELHYLRIDSSLAVLTQDSQEGAAGAACSDLLRNILKALGKTRTAEASAELAFIHSQASTEAGGQKDSLASLMQRDRCLNLLIFAHNGAELFPGISPARADFGWKFGGVDTRVTLARGLREMLAFPDLKKYCWKDLQALRERLRRQSVESVEQAPQTGGE